MSIIGLVVALVVWNWLGGLIAGVFPLAPFALHALKQTEANPHDENVSRSYFRWVAVNHLFNHVVTSLGSLLLCIGSIGEGVPAWAAWVIFALYFLFTRLEHIGDAIICLVKADALPRASSM